MKKTIFVISLLVLSGSLVWSEGPDNIQEGRNIISYPENSNHQITIYKSIEDKNREKSTVIIRDNRYNLSPTQKYYFNKRGTKPKIKIEREGRK